MDAVDELNAGCAVSGAQIERLVVAKCAVGTRTCLLALALAYL